MRVCIRKRSVFTFSGSSHSDVRLLLPEKRENFGNIVRSASERCTLQIPTRYTHNHKHIGLCVSECACLCFRVGGWTTGVLFNTIQRPRERVQGAQNRSRVHFRVQFCVHLWCACVLCCFVPDLECSCECESLPKRSALRLVCSKLQKKIHAVLNLYGLCFFLL